MFVVYTLDLIVKVWHSDQPWRGGAPITSRTHTHPSHSQTSCLLTSSLSFRCSSRTAGESQPLLTSPNPLQYYEPQVSTHQIHSNTTVSDTHNFSDAPASFVYLRDTILVATFVLLSHVSVMIFLNIPWLFSRKQSPSGTQPLPITHPWNIQDSCSLLLNSCTHASAHNLCKRQATPGMTALSFRGKEDLI